MLPDVALGGLARRQFRSRDDRGERIQQMILRLLGSIFRATDATVPRS